MQFIHIIFIVLFANTCRAQELYPLKAAQEATKENLQKPSPDADGRVQTLNKKGAMSPKLDKISQAFVEFAATPGVHTY